HELHVHGAGALHAIGVGLFLGFVLVGGPHRPRAERECDGEETGDRDPSPLPLSRHVFLPPCGISKAGALVLCHENKVAGLNQSGDRLRPRVSVRRTNDREPERRQPGLVSSARMAARERPHPSASRMRGFHLGFSSSAGQFTSTVTEVGDALPTGTTWMKRRKSGVGAIPSKSLRALKSTRE